MSEGQIAAEKTYRAIGRFIFEFSQAEYVIRHYLAEEIGLADEHFTAVVSYDVAPLCAVAKKVFGNSRRGNASEIVDLIGKFFKLNEERNRVAHALWVPFKDGGTAHHVSRSTLEPKPAVGQAVELERLADKVCALRAELECEFMRIPELERRPKAR
jgi:hypothetical protein